MGTDGTPTPDRHIVANATADPWGEAQEKPYRIPRHELDLAHHALHRRRHHGQGMELPVRCLLGASSGGTTSGVGNVALAVMDVKGLYCPTRRNRSARASTT